MAEVTPNSPARMAYDSIRTVVGLPSDIYEINARLKTNLAAAITPTDADQRAEINPKNLNDATTLLLFGVHCYMQAVAAERAEEPDLATLYRVTDSLVIDRVNPEKLPEAQARALELSASSSGLARAYSAVTGQEVDPNSSLSFAGAITFQTEAARARAILDGEKPPKRSKIVFDTDLHEFLTSVFPPKIAVTRSVVPPPAPVSRASTEPSRAPATPRQDVPIVATETDIRPEQKKDWTLEDVTIPHEQDDIGNPVYRLKPGTKTTKVVVDDGVLIHEVNWTPHIKRWMATAAGATAGMIDQSLHPRILAGSIVDCAGLGESAQQFRSAHTSTKYFFATRRGDYGGFLALLSPRELKRLAETDEEETKVTVRDPRWFNFLLSHITDGVSRDLDSLLSGTDIQERATPKPFRVIVEGLSPTTVIDHQDDDTDSALGLPAADGDDLIDNPDDIEQLHCTDGNLGTLPEREWHVEQLQTLRDTLIADLREFDVSDPKQKKRVKLHFSTFPSTYKNYPYDTIQILDAVGLSYDSHLVGATLFDAGLPYDATLASALHILEEANKRKPKYAAELTAVKMAILRAMHRIDKSDDEIRQLASQPIGHVINSLESRIKQARKAASESK